MTNRREIEEKLEQLESNSHSRELSLRQRIPYDLIEQWQEDSGHDMSHILHRSDQYD